MFYRFIELRLTIRGREIAANIEAPRAFWASLGMRITDYHVLAFVLGAAAGSLLARWNTGQPEALISRVRRLNDDIHSRMEVLAIYIDLLPREKNRIANRSVVNLDELFMYYQFASEHRFAGRQPAPFMDPSLRNRWKSLDPVDLCALLIICDKFLGLPLYAATFAMLKAKRTADYKSLLKRKDPSEASP